MGSRTIVYFGGDECLRVPVLAYAGYEIIRCDSVKDLGEALERTPQVEAVVFAEEKSKPLDEAANAARERSMAALILFAHPCSMSRAAAFDCVVLPGTPPAEWLGQMKQAREQAAARRAGVPMEKTWSDIARDLRTGRREKPAPNEAESGVRDLRHAGRIQAARRKWI